MSFVFLRTLALSISWLTASLGPSLAAEEGPGGFVVRDQKAALVDLPARRAELGETGLAFLRERLPQPAKCSAGTRFQPPRGRMRLPDRYLSGGHGAVDPTYKAAVEPYTTWSAALARRASRYAAFGEPPDALCVLEMLDNWARAGALLDYSPRESRQAWFIVEWAATAGGLALAVVLVEPALPAAPLQRVLHWLSKVAHKQTSESVGANSCCNNHAAWRGLMATVIGIVAKDDELFRYGVTQYFAVLNQISSDGSLPLEMARHELALHYHNFALLPLVGIAELTQRQGYDLFSRPNQRGRTLHDLVRFLLDRLDNPTAIERRTGIRQNLQSLKPAARNFAWMEAYRRRFPSRRFERWLPSAPFEPLLGGDARVYWRMPGLL